MATLTIPNTFVDGATIEAAEHNANFTAVKNFCESLSAGTNVDAGAIGTTQLANNAVTSGKIATGAVGTAQLAASATITAPILASPSATGRFDLTSPTSGVSLYATGTVVGHVQTATSNVGYTLALTDDGNVVEMSNVGTVTVPTDANVAFPVGTQIVIISTSTSPITIAGDTGVTVRSASGLKLRAQYSMATLLKRGSNSWIVSGDLVVA